MSERRDLPDPLHEPDLLPDRHELFAGPAYRFDLHRRDFLRVLGGGTVVVVAASGLVAADAADLPALLAASEDIGAWLHIGENGIVTVFTGKVEVGQNIRTSLTQAVADELRVEPATVRLVMGDTDRTPFDAGTFGSRTTPQMASQLRRAAATARRLLEEGGLTRDATHAQAVDDDVVVTPPGEWTVAGRDMRKVSGRDFVTGRHRYTSDLREPGMLFGRVLRPPAIGARLRALDASEAEALEGVTVVRDGDFAGVAAPDELTARRALGLLRAEWTDPPASPSHRDVFEHLKASASPSSGRRGGRTRGDVEAGLRNADVRVSATYTTAYIAHVPMEPRAALARWDEDGRLTVWTGTQRPFGVRGELARAFRIPEERVRVIMPDTGAAYGGKHTGETAVEAARLARAARRPVKLVWTREEEFHWAYFRPAALIEAEAGATREGRLTAWRFQDYNAGASGLSSPYRVANREERYHPSDTPLRQGSYRALAATANNFARESLLDELAAELGMDPLELRLRNLDDARLRAVLEAAAERFGWGRSAGAGRGHGIACGHEKGSYVATCVEASVEGRTGEVRVERAVTAFECGAIVNPDHLRSQVEGCVVMGLGGALFERIEFEDGRIRNGRLSEYRVPRFSDVPALETVLVDRPDLPSVGAGETPIIAVAPALARAIWQATGRRLRALPLAPEGVRP